MKKVLSVIAIAALSASFVACGPSAEEKAAEQAKLDSAAKALTDAFSQLGASMDSAVTATVDTAAAAVVPATETK
jgi:hypothetical protein